jgi:thymidylate synthase (FAD)
VSRRYVDSDPEFYEPSEWRAKAPNVKQGSSIDTVEDNVGICIEYTNAVKECYLTYKKMLDHGVCPEQARMILPQSMMTEWIWSGSLYAFSRVCNLRIDPHTQKETQVIAWKIYEYMERRFPVSWKELLNQKNELVI